MFDWVWLLALVPALLVVALREGLRYQAREQARQIRATLALQAEAQRQREYDEERTAYWIARLDEVTHEEV